MRTKIVIADCPASKCAKGNAISGENFGYDFDEIGNRLTARIDGTIETTYTANALNQYTDIRSVSPTYDGDGNLINDGSKQLAYNGENRLIEVKDLNDALIATYTYDDQGRRVRKVTTAQAPQGAQDLLIRWDGWNTSTQLAYRQSTNTYQLMMAYMWGLDLGGSLQGAGGVGGLILEKDAAGERYFPSYDVNGNLINLVQVSSGAVVAAYAYGPFGNVIDSSDTYGDENFLRFSTKSQDIESGLIYYGFRYYNSSFGRWINQDPLGRWMSSGALVEIQRNLFTFCSNDSIGRIDRTGLD